jgi:DNA-directed RNA polymerase
MVIKMKYLKKTSEPIKSLFTKRKLGTVSLPTTMDSVSNKIAFMPNFIHSMDATNIQILIQNYKAKKKESMNLLTIHDCFATTPNYIEELNKEVRLAFFIIYFKTDYIRSVHENFLYKIYKCTNKIYTLNNKKEYLNNSYLEPAEKNDVVNKNLSIIKRKYLQEVEIKDPDNLFLSLDIKKEYIVETKNNKFQIIPCLPYNFDKLS